MSSVAPYFCYPPIILYAKGGLPCEVATVLIDEELYRRVVCIENKAQQIFKANEKLSEPLYNDLECTEPSNIFIGPWNTKASEGRG